MSEPTAKGISKIGYILALIWVLTMGILKAFAPFIWEKELGLSVYEILLIGVAFILVCSPILFNITLDKFLSKKVG